MTPTPSWFGLKGTKVIGFKKSGLAQSIYAELKEHRLNKPVKRADVNRCGVGFDVPDEITPPCALACPTQSRAAEKQKD